MRTLDTEKRRLSELILFSLEGMITPDQINEMNELLLLHPDLQSYYLDSIAVSTVMQRSVKGCQDITTFLGDDPAVFREVIGRDLSDSAIRSAIEAEAMRKDVASANEDAMKAGGPGVAFTRRQLISALYRIAAVLVFAALLIYVDRWAWNRGANSNTAFVADMTHQLDPKWDRDLEYPYNDGRMKEGRYRLTAGTVEMRLYEGARVVIEGPAEWSLNDIDEVSLYWGKAFAKVPPAAIGFTMNVAGAKFVDLGTEFGAQSYIGGRSELHVIRGKVQLFSESDENSKSSQTIGQGQAAHYDLDSGMVQTIPIKKHAFVRRIDSTQNFLWRGHRTLDLADIVGGGDGMGSGKLNHIISIKHRKVTSKYYWDYEKGRWNAGGVFVELPSLPKIDSLFVPDGGIGANQISTTGRSFSGFPDTGGDTYGDVANGGHILHAVDRISSLKLDGKLYGTSDSPAISIHSNLGVTFDLEEIRRSVGEMKIVRFTSRCGVSESVLDDWMYKETRLKEKSAPPLADFWVLVDGRIAFERRQVALQAGGTDIEIPLDVTDRFLTLVVTDSNGNHQFDWGLFVEPVLELE